MVREDLVSGASLFSLLGLLCLFLTKFLLLSFLIEVVGLDHMRGELLVNGFRMRLLF